MADAPKKEAAQPKPAPKKAPAKDENKAKQQKAEANKAAKKAAAKAAATPGKPDTATTNAAYGVIFHPIVTEKTMFNMDKNNSLEFLVKPQATKPEIAKAIEALFAVKVHKVTTRFTRDGKRAVVRFAEGYSAEDVGMRVGVF